MKFLKLTTTDPYLNLAIEEYLFDTSDEDVFMLWQNEPTVVIGKNQNAFAEIDIGYAEEKGIHIARRITGGGAVYHDLGNVNYTYISVNSKSGDIDFSSYAEPIIKSLEKINICTKLSGRNDILIGYKKFSGNAQHRKDARVLHHGTILFNSDLGVLSSVLRPDEEKLRAKAIKSTRSRVINLTEVIEPKISVSEFIELLSNSIIEMYSPSVISAPTEGEVFNIRDRNKSCEWLFPERSYVADYEVVKKSRYSFGGVETHLKMKNDIISDVKIFGDFFGSKSITELEKMLVGKRIREINLLLSTVKLDEYISGMTSELFIEHLEI